jgi:hypothetical protein
MFKTKFVISASIFMAFLVITSSIKNETRVIEKKISSLNKKVLLKKKDINETQLDFYYLTSPAEIETRLNKIGFENYEPISFSRIFFNINNFIKLNKKISNLKNLNEEKTQKK